MAAIVNWFDGTEPLSGTGNIKLGEAYLKLNENDLGISLIKSGNLSWSVNNKYKASIALSSLTY